LKLTGNELNAPLAAPREPLPILKSPSQVIDALRSANAMALGCSCRTPDSANIEKQGIAAL
jgi:hypothetical protein